MKYFFLLILLLSSSAFIAKAQDNIFLRDGNFISCKVIEISSSEVRYKTTDNVDGPLYVIRKSTIAKIRYANGKEETLDRNAEAKNQFMDDDMARRSFYFEALGNGIRGLSMNFDFTFYRNATLGLAGRVGINPGIVDDNNLVSFPATVSALFGQKASFEFGIGFIIASYDEYSFYNHQRKNIVDLFPTGILGFRYQAKDRLFVKLAYTPTYFSNVTDNNYADNPIPGDSSGIYNNVGLSLGFAF
jgi:hypothetical protein